ncbi:MAG: hypothetical protein AAGM22_27660 [Acidobacteriota bacterium]
MSCLREATRITAVALALIGLVFQAHAQAPEPVGPQFQVNDTTTFFQGNPVVAVREDGSFIVVWESKAFDEGDLVHRIYDSLGVPLSEEIQVNDQTAGEQAGREVSISAFSDGGFVVAWDTFDDADPLANRISARRFLSSGEPNGLQFQVNSLTTGFQEYPSVAAAEDGAFAVVWHSEVSSGTDTDGRSVQMRLWDSSGAEVGTEFQVNTETYGGQISPNIDYSETTGFVVVWASEDSGALFPRARRFQSDGTAIGAQFQVNTYTEDEADTVRVAFAADGEFIVTWRSYASPGDDTSETSTQARRFASDSSPIGDQFQVNDFTAGNNDDADAAYGELGGYVVVWESEESEMVVSPDGSGHAVRLRRLLTDGTPVGDELTVNNFTTGNQDDPVVAVLGPERAVVVFESASSPFTDSSGDSVQARIFDLCPGPNDGEDADADLIPDDCDECQGDNATGDSDADGVCDDFDACLGDDGLGDGDMDGLCADRDCNDGDPFNFCAIFADGFESGDVSAWDRSM